VPYDNKSGVYKDAGTTPAILSMINLSGQEVECHTMTEKRVPQTPEADSNRSRKSRKRRIIWASLFGILVGGIVGYHLAWQWAVRATTEDPDWDGGIAVLVVYAIIGIATLVSSVVVAALSAVMTWIFTRPPSTA
jgi:hypothetical protein